MKSLFLALFRFYIEASIHVALAVCALVGLFILQHEITWDFNFLCTIFFGTITGYNFVKYAPVAKLHHRSLTRFLKGIQVFSFLSFLAMCYFAFKLPVQTLMVFWAGGILTFMYAIPLVYKTNVRSWSGCKIYIVALSWVIITVIAPTFYYGLPLNTGFLLNCLQIFVFVIALIIPFDIRDLSYDGKQLRTLPQVIGIRKSKIIAIILVLFFLILEMVQKKLVAIEATSLICLLTCFLIWKTSFKNYRFYCSFLIEAVPVIYWILLLVFID